PGLDTRSRQCGREPPGSTDAQQNLVQIRPDHGLAAVWVVVRRYDDSHLGREGPEIVAQTVAARDREILKRLVPAATRITFEPRKRRKLAGVPREDEGHGQGRGQSFRDAVIDLGEHTRSDALSAWEERAVSHDVAGVVDPLPGKRDRSDPGWRRKRLGRRRGGHEEDGDQRSERKTMREGQNRAFKIAWLSSPHSYPAV